MRPKALVLAALAVSLLLPTSASRAVTVQLDYTYDSTGFFTAHPERQLALETAAAFVGQFADSLDAIVPNGSKSWDAVITQPDTGAVTSIHNLVVPADTLVVFVGARNLGGSLGMGGPGGYQLSGTSQWIDTVVNRGQVGADDPSPADFGPWGGSVTFNDTPPFTWHFGTDTSGLGGLEADFVSVATHELCHLLGFGIAGSWQTYVSGSEFIGVSSTAVAGGPVGLDGSLSHWADGTMSAIDGVVQETTMDPVLMVGTRKVLTDLDFAGLADVGWEVIPNQATWTGNTDDHWDGFVNWSGGLAPSGPTTAVFDAAGPNPPALHADQAIGRLDFRTAGWALGGAFTLTVGDGGVACAGAGTSTISAGVRLGAAADWTVAAGSTLSLTGAFDLAGHTLTKQGAGALVVAGPQNHGSGSVLDILGGTVLFSADGAANLTVNVNGSSADFGVTQHLAALSLNTGSGRLTAGSGAVLVTGALDVDPADAFLDLTDSNLVVDYAPAGPSPIAQISGWLGSGQNIEAGYWDGPGIHSSTAANDPTGLTTLGVLDNAEYGWPDLEGAPVDESCVLVKYTYYGDADLDGSTTGDDYFLWLAGFDAAREALAQGGEPTLSGWLYGDFDYSGDVTGDDYFLWLVAFDAARSGATPLSGGAAAIPEPVSLALVGMGLVAVLARKRAEGGRKR